jgi:hypothetical protein
MNKRIFSLVYIIIIFEKNCPLKNGVDQFYPLPPKMADPPPPEKNLAPMYDKYGSQPTEKMRREIQNPQVFHQHVSLSPERCTLAWMHEGVTHGFFCI